MPKQDIVPFASGVINQPDIEHVFMEKTKIKYDSFETINSTPFDAEALSFWDETAWTQLSYMNVIHTYLD